MKLLCNIAACAFALCARSSGADARPLLLEVQPGTVKPGDVLLLKIRSEGTPLSGSIGNRALVFFQSSDGFESIAGIPIEQGPGELTIRIQFAPTAGKDGPREIAGAIEVIEPGFPSRELEVANRYLNPPPKARRWMAEDQRAFRRAYDQPLMSPTFKENFKWPREAVVTAHFGDLRVFNGAKQSQHYGTDLNGRVGDTVDAANDGVVVLARACYASGNTVVIHHGAHLFTAYFHLSKMQVRPGAKVKRGQRIGLVGKTGRVTGPHLHWAAKVDDLYVNAESLLRLKFN